MSEEENSTSANFAQIYKKCSGEVNRQVNFYALDFILNVNYIKISKQIAKNA
jgi:hypothetical protein